MAPSAVGTEVTQLNSLVSMMAASFLAGGSISFLYYADRINSLPAAVIGSAVATAILPPLARQLRAGELAAAAATQNRGSNSRCC
jgi:putative peptidoglycan lipid II flippase